MTLQLIARRDFAFYVLCQCGFQWMYETLEAVARVDQCPQCDEEIEVNQVIYDNGCKAELIK